MKYTLEFSERAIKDLKKLDYYTQKMLLKWIQKHLIGIEDPRSIGKALTGSKKGFWRYRVGDYRIITMIKDDKFIILVFNFGHRKEIYS